MTIIMQAGQFLAVSPNAAIPPGAEVLDAAGLVAYAGFIDAATDRGFRGGEAGWAERRNREDTPQDAVAGPLSRTSEAWRNAIHPTWNIVDRYDANAAAAGEHRKCGFATALVTPADGLLSGRAAVLQLGDQPLRRSILRESAALCAALVPTGPGDEYPTTIPGAVALFRQTMLDAEWFRHAQTVLAAGTGSYSLPTDPDLALLGSVLPRGAEGSTPDAVLFSAMADDDSVHRALDAAAEFRLRPIILAGSHAWKCAERLKRERTPLILSLALPEEPTHEFKGKWADTLSPSVPATGPAGGPASSSASSAPAAATNALLDDDWHKRSFEPRRVHDERKRLWNEHRDSPRRLQEAGVSFAFSTRGAKSPEEALGNLRKMIDGGLSANAALRALTTDAAELLGIGSRVGRVAPGQIANLVVMTGPFDNKDSKVRWTFVAGRKFEFDAKPGDKKADGHAAATSSAPSSNAAATAAAPPATAPAATPPTATASAGMPAGDGGLELTDPIWATEIEADRAPTFRTNGNVLLRGATLLTITAGDQPNTDLLIQNGRIASIGKNIPLPPNTTLIELPGLYVSPGIIDCHSHMGLNGGLNEASQSVTPEVRMSDIVNHDDISLFRALAGGVTMIHTMHGSANTIGGQNVVLKLKWGRPSADLIARDAPLTIKFALGENVKRSNGPGNSTRFPASRMGVETTLRRALGAAREYGEQLTGGAATRAASAPVDTATPLPPRRDLRLEALNNVLGGRIWVHSHCYRADEILRLLDVAEEFGFRIGVLQHVLEGYRIIPEILRHGCAASTFSDWWTYKVEAADAIPHNAARMAQAGIVATMNSDSAELVRHLPLEAAKSVRFGGLTANDALRLVTLNAAGTLGMAHQVGSLETGKTADIAVFTGHPMDTFGRCVLTMIEGEVYFVARDLFGAPPATQPAATQPKPAPQPTAEIVRTARVVGRPALDLTPRASASTGDLTIPPSPSGQYAIRGATLHPVSQPPIQNGVIIFSPAGIRTVGTADVSIPAGITMIDAAGLHVYPGLINASTTLGLSEVGSVPATNDQREIGQFQPDVWAASAINPHSDLIPVARCEGVTSVLVIPSGGDIAGRCALVHTVGWTMPEMLIDIPMGDNTEATPRGLTRFGPLVVRLPTLPEGMAAEARDKRINEYRESLKAMEEYFRVARRYADATTPGAPPPWLAGRDDRLEAMRPYVTRQLPILVSADTVKEMLEAIRFAERLNLRLILRGCDDGWKIAKWLAARPIGLILSGPPNLPRSSFDPFDCVFANAAGLADARASFCFGGGDASLVKQVATDAGLAVAYGLDADRAIHALTLGAAQVLGVQDRLGSLSANKIADLIICNGHPCQASTRVQAVFINGRPTEMTSVHTRNDERFRNRPPPTLPPMRRDLKGPPAIRIAK